MSVRLITPHFSVEEFACRDGTTYPKRWGETRLRPLCELLEVLRASVWLPIKIISGYRTPEYNRRIGGARYSQHVLGRAADIIVAGVSSRDVHAEILRLRGIGKLPRLGGLGKYKDFCHVDTRRSDRLVRWEGSRTAGETSA